jgi:ketosteroid isomerase-like protein
VQPTAPVVSDPDHLGQHSRLTGPRHDRNQSSHCAYRGQVDQLERYIDGWRRHDIPAVLDTVADECVVIESYGPVYRGKSRVEQWMNAWFGAGGTVDGWEITSKAAVGDTLVAEWTFSCTWNGDPATFDGSTVARLDGGRIAYLREYATTAPLYEWTGTWRDQA